MRDPSGEKRGSALRLLVRGLLSAASADRRPALRHRVLRRYLYCKACQLCGASGFSLASPAAMALIARARSPGRTAPIINPTPLN